MRALRPLMRFRRFDIDVASIDQILPQRVSQKGGHRHAAFRRGALDRPLGLSGDFDRKLDRLVIAYHHTAASASSRADSTRHDRTGDISRPSNRAGRATPDNRPRSLRRKPLPRLLEIGASMIEGGGRAVPEFSGLASRINRRSSPIVDHGAGCRCGARSCRHGRRRNNGLNIYSMFVAVVGAIIVLVILPRYRWPTNDLISEEQRKPATE
jgi:hypothetical protein